MAPVATPAPLEDYTDLVAAISEANAAKKGNYYAGHAVPPPNAIKRYLAAGIDLTQGYPAFPELPADVEAATAFENQGREGHAYVDPAGRADPEKKALFAAAREVNNLTKHIGTEIVGLQLKDLTNQQRDELALLVAERGVVFFRDQDLPPQAQVDLGLHLGDGQIKTDSVLPHVPGLDRLGIIWDTSRPGPNSRSFRLPWPGIPAHGWHIDTAADPITNGYTHLFQDTVPSDSGDTLWSSGYAAYDKLSPGLKKWVDGLTGIYRSTITFKNPERPDGPPIPILERAPVVRTHPVTKWKTLFVTRQLVGLEGFDKKESDHFLKYLVDVVENTVDIQVRWHWTPNASAIWDNRVVAHTVSRDFDGERHGTRVQSYSDRPFFDPESKSRGEALGLPGWNVPAFDTEAHLRAGFQL
ncbi:hypothetical protein Q8F55_004426 [Vanrija albida]|uniref:TauD/TfdA-like domain-containing protein n=1 Tax=Vanrija albida TaxID=181172 RepID=A0ABR3Q6Q1_9TREE